MKFRKKKYGVSAKEDAGSQSQDASSNPQNVGGLKCTMGSKDVKTKW